MDLLAAFLASAEVVTVLMAAFEGPEATSEEPKVAFEEPEPAY